MAEFWLDDNELNYFGSMMKTLNKTVEELNPAITAFRHIPVNRYAEVLKAVNNFQPTFQIPSLQLPPNKINIDAMTAAMVGVGETMNLAIGGLEAGLSQVPAIIETINASAIGFSNSLSSPTYPIPYISSGLVETGLEKNGKSINSGKSSYYDLSMDDRVFISHAGQDDDKVKRIEKYLNQHGIFTWTDHQNIQWGDEWDKAIGKALTQCKAMILVVSSSSMKSPWTRKEWIAFMMMNKPVYLVRLQPCKLSWTLSNCQYVNFVDFFENTTIGVLRKLMRKWGMQITSQ
jgi:hypothetical protein